MDETLRLRPVSRAAAGVLGTAALVGAAIILIAGLSDPSATAGWIAFCIASALVTLIMAWLFLASAIQGRDAIATRFKPMPVVTYRGPVEAFSEAADRIAADQELIAALRDAAATDATTHVLLLRVLTTRLAMLRLMHHEAASILRGQANLRPYVAGYVAELERAIASCEHDLGRLGGETTQPGSTGAV
jgi:hypothetical protein